MKFGYFDDVNKEYVITTPKTPLPWINYLGTQDFFSLISNTAGGYSFYKDAKLLRLTRYRYNNSPMDQNGRYYYIKEGDTVWNPGWQPVQTPLDSYQCRHGLGYTVFESSKNSLNAKLLAFVPVHDNCEINLLTLTNYTDAEKEFDLFSYIEFCLWNAADDSSNFQRNFSTGEVEVAGSTIITRRNTGNAAIITRYIRSIIRSTDLILPEMPSSDCITVLLIRRQSERAPAPAVSHMDGLLLRATIST